VAGERSGEVSLWLVDLDAAGEWDDRRILDELTSEERERAVRLRSPLGARRWKRARGALREILARSSGVDAADVEIVVGERGKPALAPSSPIRFNLAHSAGLALVALSPTREIGVDVERVRDGLHEAAIARRMLGEDAVARLAALDPDERTGEFFRLWVRHEAAVKCRGTGLADAVGRDVDEGLAIGDVEVADGYAAAWAIDGPLPDRPVRPIPFAWSGGDGPARAG